MTLSEGDVASPQDCFTGRWPPAEKGSTTSSGASREPGLREVVLNAIRSAGENGLTSDEAELVLVLPHQTVSARVHELSRLGAIVDTGQRRRTRSKRLATVWKAA